MWLADTRRAVPLYGCAITRKELEAPRPLDTSSRSKGARRRARLHRGARRWHRSVTCARARVWRVFTLTLTVQAEDPIAAQGAVLALMHAYRAATRDPRYFWWAELQERGAVHYHAILVNPPWKDFERLRSFLSRHWSLSPLTPWVGRLDPRLFQRRGAEYAMAYTKKERPRVIGERNPASERSVGNSSRSVDKSAQQAYDDMPRELRTFGHQLLEHRLADIDLHLDEAILDVSSDWKTLGGRWWEHIQIVGFLHHTRARGGCTMPRRQKKRPVRSIQTPDRPRKDSGATNTKALP